MFYPKKYGDPILTDALFDEWRQVESWKPESLLSTRLGKHLPHHFDPIYARYLYKSLGICVVTVAWKLAQPTLQPLASRAEALAAWVMTEEAKAVFMQAGTEDEAAQAFQPFLNGYVKPARMLALFDSPDKEEGTESEAYLSSRAIGYWSIPFSKKYKVHPYTLVEGGVPRVGRAYKEHLHPAEQEALDAGVTVLIDELFEDFAPHLVGFHTGEHIVQTNLGEHLPLRYLPKYTPGFLKKFAVCVLTVAWKLAQARYMPLSSVAEELAAHAILTQANLWLELDQEDAKEEGRPTIPLELAFESFREAYFEDEDFLFLFDDFYDGVDRSPVGQMLHMTSLEFHDWFRPFTSDPWRIAHPYVFENDPAIAR